MHRNTPLALRAAATCFPPRLIRKLSPTLQILRILSLRGDAFDQGSVANKQKLQEAQAFRKKKKKNIVRETDPDPDIANDGCGCELMPSTLRLICPLQSVDLRLTSADSVLTETSAGGMLCRPELKRHVGVHPSITFNSLFRGSNCKQQP